MASRDQHAVVIGASMSGLLAARSLTTHFDRVTVVDRDEMPHEPVTRGGVPQGRHTHGLLARGREVIEELFPGTTADLEARGALRGDAQADARWHFAQQPLAPGRCGLELLAVSRPLLEWYVRYRLLADAGRRDPPAHLGPRPVLHGPRRPGGRRTRHRPRRRDPAPASRRPRRRRLRPDLAYAGVAGATWLPDSAGGRAADRQALRHPAVPALRQPGRRQVRRQGRVRGHRSRRNPGGASRRGDGRPGRRPLDGVLVGASVHPSPHRPGRVHRLRALMRVPRHRRSDRGTDPPRRGDDLPLPRQPPPAL